MKRKYSRHEVEYLRARDEARRMNALFILAVIGIVFGMCAAAILLSIYIQP